MFTRDEFLQQQQQQVPKRLAGHRLQPAQAWQANH